MQRLVSLFNSNDLRYLLDIEELPEGYDVSQLLPVIDNIFFEYEELSGKKFYSQHLKESDYKIKQESIILALTTIQECLLLDRFEDAKNINKTWKLGVKTFEQADLKVRKITQNLNVQAMKDSCPDCAGKDKDCHTCNGTNKVKSYIDWGAMCANVNIQLKINPKDSTVAEYLHYEKTIKQMNKSK